MNPIATAFLNRCFSPDETIALLLRRENPTEVTQRVVRMERALAPRYQAWLSYENSTGANVYVASNPLRSGSRKRTKESIASVRHLYMDIDSDGDARLATLRASKDVPIPTVILSTSPGKYQVLWRVEGFDFACQEQALKLLAVVYGGDPACTDRNRVLRIPGFLNRKYDPACRVTVEYPCDSVCKPGDFRLDIPATETTIFTPTNSGRKPPRKHSHSESDWAWVFHELAHSKDAGELTRELASLRTDKPNPLYYAQRTVDVASARLWLIEGIRVDDIITMLECRRRFELPSAVAGPRAREIAMTAQRMIARRKIA